MEYLSRINTSLRTLEILCNRYQVRRMAFFGSVLRDDFNEYSDVDVLVEFLPGAEIDYVDFHTFQQELSELFRRPVDLILKAELVQQIRQEKVLDTLQVVYETE